VAAIADALGLGRFAVLGHSGGGPHALACAALLPARVTAAVSVSAPAPFDADGLDWFAGWSWLAGVDGQAIEQGNEGYLEDTLAAVRPWGFRPDAIEVPALIMHGARDKMVPPAHGDWLAARCPAAASRVVPDAGHITVLDSAPGALAWLAARC